MNLPRLLSALGLFGLILGMILLPVSIHPDAYLSQWKSLGVFGFFIFWLTAVLLLGLQVQTKVLQRKFNAVEFFIPLSLGSAAWVAISFTLGHLGWVGYDSRLYLMIFLLLVHITLGWLVDYPALKPVKISRIKNSLLNLKPLDAAIYLFTALIAVQYILQGFLLHSTSDPMMYHLLGPRLWAEQGQVYFDALRPFSYQAWYWEYLYLTAMTLTGDAGPYGLIEGQLFSQWIHIFIGSLGCGFVFFALAKKLSLPTAWSCLAALLIYTSQDLHWAIFIAKNDWGNLFWLSTSIYLLFFGFKSQDYTHQNNSCLRNAVATGIFFALSLGSKPTSLIVIISACIVFAILIWSSSQRFSNREKLQILFFMPLATLITLIPLFFRNAMATGNPFFPFAANYFTQKFLSTYMQDYFKLVTAPKLNLDFSFWLQKTIINIKDSPYSKFALFFLFTLWIFAIIKNKKQKAGSRLGKHTVYFVIFIALMLATTWPGFLHYQNQEFVRWTGWPLILLPFTMAVSAYYLLEKLTRHLQIIAKNLALICLFGVVSWSTFSVLPWKTFYRADPPAYVLVSSIHMGGSGKAWLRLNLKKGEITLSTGENQLYYVSHLPVYALTEAKPYFEQIKDQKQLLPTLNILAGAGVKYILDIPHFGVGWNHYANAISATIKKYPEAAVFSHEGTSVIDIRRLAEKLADDAEIAL